MYSRAIELTVGCIHPCWGLGALPLLALKVSGLSLSQQADIPSVWRVLRRWRIACSRQGLACGVTIGQVKSITLDPQSLKAKVEMEIHSDVDYLSWDSIAGH